MKPTKTDAEMTPAERAARQQQRDAVRQQIQDAQAANANRDAAALRKERAWFRRQGK